jgi:hypothetical protein
LNVIQRNKFLPIQPINERKIILPAGLVRKCVLRKQVYDGTKTYR